MTKGILRWLRQLLCEHMEWSYHFKDDVVTSICYKCGKEYKTWRLRG